MQRMHKMHSMANTLIQETSIYIFVILHNYDYQYSLRSIFEAYLRYTTTSIGIQIGYDNFYEDIICL